MAGNTAGRELPKEYRAIVNQLVREQGWRYEYKGRHGRLYPADKSKAPLTFPTTPGDGGRGFKNFVADVRRAGGQV